VGEREPANLEPLTSELLPAAARLHCEALQGSRTALMGEAYVEAFLGWFAKGTHDALAFAAVERFGRLIGYVVGAPSGYAVNLSRALVWPAARAVLGRPWLLLAPPFRRGMAARLRLPMSRRPPTGAAGGGMPQTSLMSLVAMAVAPDVRRRGTGRALVRAFEKAAADRGAGGLRLWTQRDNTAARAFYEGCGWQPVAHSAGQMLYVRVLPAPAGIAPGAMPPGVPDRHG
jgi:GNAT superfamily N-acetyltransferase